jgi:hypothetical protein
MTLGWLLDRHVAEPPHRDDRLIAKLSDDLLAEREAREVLRESIRAVIDTTASAELALHRVLELVGPTG